MGRRAYGVLSVRAEARSSRDITDRLLVSASDIEEIGYSTIVTPSGETGAGNSKEPESMMTGLLAKSRN